VQYDSHSKVLDNGVLKTEEIEMWQAREEEK